MDQVTSGTEKINEKTVVLSTGTQNRFLLPHLGGPVIWIAGVIGVGFVELYCRVLSSSIKVEQMSMMMLGWVEGWPFWYERGLENL